MVTLKQIQRDIAKEMKQIKIEENIQKALDRKRQAQSKLILLKNRRVIAKGKKLRALSGRFGKSLLKTGQKLGRKVGPAIIKQARLIKEQQLRDDARERALSRKPNTSTKKRSSKRRRR